MYGISPTSSSVHLTFAIVNVFHVPDSIELDANECVGGLDAATGASATSLGLLGLAHLVHLLLGVDDGLVAIDVDLPVASKALLHRDGTLGSILHTLEEVGTLAAALPPNVGQVADAFLGLLALLLVAGVLARFLHTGLEVGQDLLPLVLAFLGLLVGGLRQELLGPGLDTLQIVLNHLKVLVGLLLGSDELVTLVGREAVAAVLDIRRGVVDEVEDVVGIPSILLDKGAGIVGPIIRRLLLGGLLLSLGGRRILVVTVLIEGIRLILIGHVLQTALEYRRWNNALELLLTKRTNMGIEICMHNTVR